MKWARFGGVSVRTHAHTPKSGYPPRQFPETPRKPHSPGVHTPSQVAHCGITEQLQNGERHASDYAGEQRGEVWGTTSGAIDRVPTGDFMAGASATTGSRSPG
ncbi:MAG TPA: hypothetical protein VJ436_09500, partial [Anaerolineales bacterium]|nr:hypothetical protein [Anaerolineales bacterium]